MNIKVLMSVLVIILLTACGQTASPVPSGSVPSIQSGEIKVSIANFAFDPATITITTGSTVTWTNNDTVSHNVLGDDGSWGSNSLAKRDTFSYKFSQAGTYSYHCGVHPSMKATITVVAP